MRDYRRILAWQLADELAVAVYHSTRSFPVEEKYALTSQLRRAAYSIAANIAEGAGRRTVKDFLRFLDMALGSANETDYFIHLAKRINYLEPEQYLNLAKQIASVSRCLASYIRSVERDLDQRE